MAPENGPPENAWFGRASRLKTLPVALWPMALGAAYAGHFDGHVGRVVAAFVATGLLHVGAALTGDLVDQTSGAAKIARMERGSVPTGTDAIVRGLTTASRLRLLAGAALGAGLVLWLATGEGLALGVAAVVLAPAWPMVPAGLSEIATSVGRAGLPFLATVAAIDGRLSGRAIAVAAIPTAFAALHTVAEGLLQWRADRAVGRRTLPARAEPERTLVILGATITATYVALVLEVAFDALPSWSLLALATAAPLAGAWGRAYRDPAPQHMLRFLGATLGTSLLVGVVLTVVLASA